MTTALVVLAAAIYVVVTLVVAAEHAVDYSINCEMARNSDERASEGSALTDWYKGRAEARRAEAAEAARAVFQAPLWPLTALKSLMRMYAHSRADS